ncbi:uncharacterized protein LOC111330974 [Stylophora pistillata]|uniref:uncharacterized protein LOC111330974 n=1 Tax=Stylophora pistillata TaxID=50429 RepID=UPI000C04FB6B|nr:uncharacterized protein LOC111330974 [Stylophora pistillata]
MENISKSSEMGCSSIKCSRKLMSDHVMHQHQLPDKIGDKWKQMARHLDFQEAVIGTIENDKKGVTNECCITVIVAWINQEGNDATLERLADALTKIRLKKVAEILQDLLLSGEDVEPGTNDSKQMVNGIDVIEKTCKHLKKECHQLEMRKQELEKEKQSMTKQLQDSLEESNKLRTRIHQLEEELSRVKQELHDTSQETYTYLAIYIISNTIGFSQSLILKTFLLISSTIEQCQKWKTRSSKPKEDLAGIRGDRPEQNLAQNFDISHREDESEDSTNYIEPERADKEGEINERLKDLNDRLYKNVTSVLELPEIKEDKLKVPVTLDLLGTISKRLQELYSAVLSMVAETCKCSEEVKREFYDFAYHGLRAEHNDAVHRVEDLATAQDKMTDEEKKEFGKLLLYQTNRQRQVNRLENLWRGLFSTVWMKICF